MPALANQPGPGLEHALYLSTAPLALVPVFVNRRELFLVKSKLLYAYASAPIMMPQQIRGPLDNETERVCFVVLGNTLVGKVVKAEPTRSQRQTVCVQSTSDLLLSRLIFKYKALK